ncbi:MULTISPECIES: hypothetical protein [Ensifer]|jgi:hypothetical protein|uniref:Uncharacterized protein n=1 Tax=Ensifer canadensis TaxID=555315 RepID=A0AAW4FHF3_9HYPH|nr:MULTISPECIES: hypothetical protein [Ensifer]MDP9629444.1 hypothetical protein [Ensifer adhaerens]KQU90769.1 hypothetical protein ASD00_05310 [Ensifer sp. Root31]KQW50190.1 hypothetical protein ASD02_09570 [Ensifer sp. Root1252]KQY62951.1 hypothetical protein ASD52_12045 [Ensifer sp. Root142]KRC74414.1 hypothetical protein ASE32_05655 [Ensifer sp. Root231]
MTFRKRAAMICLVWAVLFGIGELAKDVPVLAIPTFTSDAVAVVGRPLTPVSVAGAARRTTRRCAAGVYNC